MADFECVYSLLITKSKKRVDLVKTSFKVKTFFKDDGGNTTCLFKIMEEQGDIQHQLRADSRMPQAVYEIADQIFGLCKVRVL